MSDVERPICCVSNRNFYSDYEDTDINHCFRLNAYTSKHKKKTIQSCLFHSHQGSRDDLSMGGGVTSVTRHGNSVDTSFSKEVLNSITGIVGPVCVLLPVSQVFQCGCQGDGGAGGRGARSNIESSDASSCTPCQFSRPWRLRRATRRTPAAP